MCPPQETRERAWADLVGLLLVEVERLREHIEKAHGERLPYPSAEVVARLRVLHGDPVLAGPIERLVDA